MLFCVEDPLVAFGCFLLLGLFDTFPILIVIIILYFLSRLTNTMAIADVMDDVDYKTINFNIEEAEFRHPLWLTESHFVYNLYRDDEGHLNCHRNTAGDPILSPRYV